MFFTAVFALVFYIIDAKFDEENIDYNNPSDLFYNSFKMATGERTNTKANES